MKAKWEKMVDGKALVDSCRDFAATQNWLRLKGVTYKDDGKVLLSVNVAEWVIQDAVSCNMTNCTEMSDHHPVSCSPAKSELVVCDPAVPVRFLYQNQTRTPTTSLYCLYAGKSALKRPQKRRKIVQLGEILDGWSAYSRIVGNWRSQNKHV